jgi:hypothetical protein
MFREIAYQLGRVFGSVTKAKVEDQPKVRTPPTVPTLTPPPSRSFHSKVAGVAAKNDDGKSRQDYIRAFCKAGTSLQLVREPKNKFDPNAVGVWVTVRVLIGPATAVQIGYIGADLARDLAPLIDGGTPVQAEVSQVTGGGEKTMGVNLLVTRG